MISQELLSQLEFRVGTDILREFVANHSIADVLRELVQNEYDAGGSRLVVDFENDSLHVSGNGEPIDSGGWRRLSVMMSTGAVAGATDERIPPKINGIGSKNLGLRTLFLIGDQISIRSSGRMTVMDVNRGTLAFPIPDPQPDHPNGVAITVPYRLIMSGTLQAFGVDRERDAFDLFAKTISGVISKLAMPGVHKNLRAVRVTSQRLGRRVSWSQEAKAVDTGTRGVRGIRRSINRYDSIGTGAERRSRREEIEFIRVVPAPVGLLDRPVPGYYRRGRTSIAIGVSIPVRGEAIQLRDRGTIYYPLAAPNSPTGYCLSISAPFLMSEDRSTMLPHPINEALLSMAASLVIDLLKDDWYGRFGEAVYEALMVPSGDGAFASVFQPLLEEAEVWPTRSRKRGKVVFQAAKELVVPRLPALRPFLEDNPESTLDIQIAESATLQRVVLSMGATAFTMNSLVRLRCAGEDAGTLQTKLAITETDWHYTNYPNLFWGAEGLAIQVAMANAFDERGRLSPANRADIRDTASTLTGGGTVRPVSELWLIPETVEADVVAPDYRLHPRLASSKTLRQMARTFSFDTWLTRVCSQAATGTATDDEREAAFRFVLSMHGRFRSRLLAAIRRSPIVRNHRGDWVAPNALVSRRIIGAALLEPVLSFPHAAYSKDSALIKRLRVGAKLKGTHLISFATEYLAEDSAAAFEELLFRVRDLLVPSTVARLAKLEILRSSSGGLAPAGTLYLDVPELRSILDDSVHYVMGSHPDLYRRLGCRSEPKADDIVTRLAAIKEQGRTVPRPEQAYGALVDALRREGRPLTEFATSSIVGIDSLFLAPIEILVGARLPVMFQRLSVVRGPEPLCEALVALGARRTPSSSDWAALLRAICGTYPAGRSITRGDKRSLLDAYSSLARLPGLEIVITATDRILLSTSGTLHSTAEAAAGSFVLNDDPILAAAARDQGAAIAIADESESSQLFFRTLALKGLTEVAGPGTLVSGEPAVLPSSVNVEVALAQLHTEDFASAIAALVRHELRGSHLAPPRVADIHRRLRAIRRFHPTSSIQSQVRVGRVLVSVPKHWWVLEDSILIAGLKSKDAFYGILSSAVAELLVVDRLHRGRISDSIYRILGRRSSSVRDYLAERGIPWRPNSSIDVGEEDAEDVVGAAIQEAIGTVLNSARQGTQAPNRPGSQGSSTPPERTPFQLPAIETVTVTTVETGPPWSPGPRKPGAGRGGSGGWSAPEADPERDALIGRRAEEIVVSEERARLSRRGQDPDRVVWIAEQVTGADHDIRSIDADGHEIWIEVKGTVGVDGRFHWPVEQVSLAMTKRDRYVLWRVYNVASTSPVTRPFTDPIGMLSSGSLRLDVSGLIAEVAPLSASGAPQDLDGGDDK